MSADKHYPFPEPESDWKPTEPPKPVERPEPSETGSKRSQTIGKLIEALCKAQLEFAPVVKANLNPQFKSKYADLATIIQATMPALAKNGLAIIQTPHVKGRELTMTTLLVHTSDEWISNDLTMPATMRNELTAQTIGSACTYSRRYALQSILGIAADLDDDGEQASGGGSKDAANAVAERKIAEHKAKLAVVPSLFFVHHAESDMYEVTGDEALMKFNREVLKKFWNKTASAVLVTGEQLEDLKYTFEQNHVPFTQLKEK
jgi:hypothetical protein